MEQQNNILNIYWINDNIGGFKIPISEWMNAFEAGVEEMMEKGYCTKSSHTNGYWLLTYN